MAVDSFLLVESISAKAFIGPNAVGICVTIVSTTFCFFSSSLEFI